MFINCHQNGAVFHVRLNRPRSLNAVNREMAFEFLAALEQADANSDVRVVILSGEGRSFCAGRDINEPPNPVMMDVVQKISTTIMSSPKIFIVAAHGWLVGAGLEWALNCDIALFAESVRVKLPESALGVFATGGVITLLPRTIGLMRSKALLLLGEEINSSQAQQFGIAWAVVPDENLQAQAEAMATRIAERDPSVVSRFKKALNQFGAESFGDALKFECQMHHELGH